jgi:hypothetical protein
MVEKGGRKELSCVNFSGKKGGVFDIHVSIE